MGSSKWALTFRHLHCYLIIFSSFFHVFSNGFTWIQTPREKTDAEIGKSVALRWHYNLSENETHFQSDFTFLKGNLSSTLAIRNERGDSFQKRNVSWDFEVHGKQNVSLVLNNVQESFDGLLCLKVKYKFDGIVQDGKLNCTKLYSIEPPIIYTGPENVTVRENKTIILQCKAHGEPQPKLTWTKGDSMSIIGIGKTYIKARADKCDAGVYRCTADNDVKEPVSAQATVEVRSFPEVPEIIHISISVPNIKVKLKQPATNCSLPITGYLVRVRKIGSPENGTDCEARHVKYYEWTCSFGDLESGTAYNMQIFAKNRFGQGKPVGRHFKTMDSGSKMVDVQVSKKYLIVIGASAGGGIVILIFFCLKRGVSVDCCNNCCNSCCNCCN